MITLTLKTATLSLKKKTLLIPLTLHIATFSLDKTHLMITSTLHTATCLSFFPMLYFFLNI